MTVEELKNCPFCGAKAKIKKHTFHRLSPTYGVECWVCGSQSGQFYGTEKDAIEAWNRRAKK